MGIFKPYDEARGIAAVSFVGSSRVAVPQLNSCRSFQDYPFMFPLYLEYDVPQTLFPQKN